MDGLKRDATERFSDSVFFLRLILLLFVGLYKLGNIHCTVTFFPDMIRVVDVYIKDRRISRTFVNPPDYLIGVREEPTAVEYGREQVH